jgi:hypothetical protein
MRAKIYYAASRSAQASMCGGQVRLRRRQPWLPSCVRSARSRLGRPSVPSAITTGIRCGYASICGIRPASSRACRSGSILDLRLQEREQVRSSLMSKVLGENMSPSTPQVPKHLHSTREHVAARPFPFFLDGHPGVARKSIPRKEHLMSNLQYTRGLVSFISAALILPSLALAQSQITTTQVDQPNRVAVAYVPPKNPDFQELYLL